MKKTIVIKVDVRDPDLSRIREIARKSREGKIVSFPTETVYGVGGPMSVSHLAERLNQIKGRDRGKAFAYHLGELEMLEVLHVERTAPFRYLTRLFWPGPLTLLVENRKKEKIGLRFPQHRVATALINATGVPFIATSANLSGEPSPIQADQVMAKLDGKIDYLIDAGPCPFGTDSTIVDLTAKEPVVVREGAELEPIRKALEQIKTGLYPRKRILFVCTGNSCRSPMAAGWLRKELRMKGLEKEIEIRSCGIGARRGAPPTMEAELVMRNREVDISEHRSHPCSREDALNADLIFAMGEYHADFIAGLVPSVRKKIKVLNIPDPIGLGIMIYEEVITSLERKLKEHWDKIVE